MALPCLEYLPNELYLEILFGISDIASLDSVLRASPKAYRLFDNHSVAITDAVLDSGYTCGHIRVVFRIIALLRSGTLPIKSLEHFQERVLDESMQYRYRVRASRTGLAPQKIAKDTSPEVLKSILATARHIHCLSHECLSLALGRLKAVEVEHLVDKNVYTSILDFVSVSEPRPATIKFEAQDSGPPSWVEEQRATRACWRLQLIYDLKRAAQRSQLDWSEADVSKLTNIPAIIPPSEMTGPNERYRSSRPGLYNWYQSRYTRDDRFCDHAEFEEILTIIQHVRDQYGPESADKIAYGNLSCKDLNGHREIQREWPLPGPCRENEWRQLLKASYDSNHMDV
ncbi:hypothetical protein E4U21_000692 [Claviceps maximensis]|nr:hypothetical protein E4U21_000692 [Claviceps maximensis]